mgnify:FL=1
MNISDKISNIIESIYSLNSDIELMEKANSLKNPGLLDLELATYHLRVLLEDIEREKKAE